MVEKKKKKPVQRVKNFPETFPADQHETDLTGGTRDKLPPLEPTLPPPASQFPAAEGDIHDPVRVLRLAYIQMTIEKLRSNQTAYRLSFDNQIKELTGRKATTLTQIQQELITADGMYQAIQKEIEEAHGISLKGYTFNPDAGTLNRVIDPTKKLDGNEAGNSAPPQ